MKVADYIIGRLADEGIGEVFLVYGAANGDLVDAFTRTDKTRYICAMHEQGAGFMAEGYAKASGNFGAAIATSGPGGMNFVTPIGNCFYDSVPCLFITGQVKQEFMRPNTDIRQVGFQEADIVGIVEPITKYARLVLNPEEIGIELDKAIFYMKEGRQGPVLLDVPIDVQKADINVDKLQRWDWLKSEENSKNYIMSRSDELIFDELMEDLKKSKRPVILVGAGSKKAMADIQYFSESLSIPTFPTWNALDIVTSDWKTYGGKVGTYGGEGRNFAIQNSDLLICLGTRISGRITGGNPSSFARAAKKWLIDIDPENKSAIQSQGINIDKFIVHDVKTFIRYFTRYLIDNYAKKEVAHKFDEWMKKAHEWRDKYDPVKEIEKMTSPEPYDVNLTMEQTTGKTYEGVNPYLFMRELSDQCGPDDIIVSDCGGNVVITHHAFKFKKGQTYITNNGNSPMGFSMCGAIGAWFVERPPSNIVCIIGDGGMTMNIQELQTIVSYGINIKIFVLNNNIYGITKAFQEVNFEGRAEACGPKGYKPPDFMEVCKAYGIEGFLLNERNESLSSEYDKDIKGCIQGILELQNSAVINVMCPNWHLYYPKISGWKTPIEDQEPYLSRDEFKSNMIIDPLPGWENCKYEI